MNGSRIIGVGRALVLAAALASLAPGVAVAAEPTTCPTTRAEAAKVTIDAPRPDSDVSGRVEVKGKVEAASPLFQVELFVGDARRDITYVDPPSAAADFTLVWDTAAARSGPTTLRVVACGSSPEGFSLIRGTASAAVKVRSSPAPSENRALVETASRGLETRGSSLVMGAVMAVPAVAGLFYAASGRRRRM